ncbi:hypothetical protein [Paenibacillus radicis (ex Gao et al. 2016)]|uniref:Uncharacterized protein n=1 Tax=Paenibacillus radicis (ex Gao et al. 2016) TaxID=1737354 RepID=A0A917HFG7_9BACL|nr:hypothetical protein [Paenibacillus radicis (ex Gao et al. 2016)]GGG77557.1 hypothetical protein GCM10010918_37830 [Paenibacillus radicis (ex Gao et al. 2016)]
MITVLHEGTEPLPDIQQLPSLLKVSHIELYIIRAESGHRAYMRLSTNAGTGWSELFIQQKEQPADWNAWCSSAPHYIGWVNLHTVAGSPHSEKIRNYELRSLFDEAVRQVCRGQSHPGSRQPSQTEYAELFRQSVFYLSLF